MAKKQTKTGLIVTIIALALTLGVVSTLVILQRLDSSQTDQTTPRPAATTDATSTDSTDEANTKPDAPTTIPTVDPETLGSVDIEPLKITVFYTKGLPGFEFSIKRTTDKTDYVEFTAPGLVGTKCTNDTGVFASIIKNPSSSEDQTTISQKTTVGSATYGLSLSAANCTGDQSLLEEYQAAFKNGFSSLKSIE